MHIYIYVCSITIPYTTEYDLKVELEALLSGHSCASLGQTDVCELAEGLLRHTQREPEDSNYKMEADDRQFLKGGQWRTHIHSGMCWLIFRCFSTCFNHLLGQIAPVHILHRDLIKPLAHGSGLFKSSGPALPGVHALQGSLKGFEMLRGSALYLFKSTCRHRPSKDFSRDKASPHGSLYEICYNIDLYCNIYIYFAIYLYCI